MTDLTRNQSLVLATLEKATGPLSAYAILDALRDEGLRAPLQIYRALDKLGDIGLVHKVESLNAFVACRHSHCGSEETAVFAICDDCGKVEEFSDDQMDGFLKSLADDTGFHLKSSAIELRGLCHHCHQTKEPTS